MPSRCWSIRTTPPATDEVADISDIAGIDSGDVGIQYWQAIVDPLTIVRSASDQ